jgi:hypothetical protein
MKVIFIDGKVSDGWQDMHDFLHILPRCVGIYRMVHKGGHDESSRNGTPELSITCATRLQHVSPPLEEFDDSADHERPVRASVGKADGIRENYSKRKRA